MASLIYKKSYANKRNCVNWEKKAKKLKNKELKRIRKYVNFFDCQLCKSVIN